MKLVKDLPISERPREKALHFGVKQLSSRELLALLLRCGVKGQSALDTADILLQKAGGLKGISRMTIQDMMKIRGLSKIKALELHACLELATRIAYEDSLEDDVISSPASMIRFLKLKLGPLQQEVFYVVLLDYAHHIIHMEALFQGTQNQSSVSPKEIFQYALKYAASALMLVHNHPSGTLTPSEADILFTYRVVEGAKVLDLRILDHLIITQNRYLSFREEGLIKDVA